MRWWRAMLTRRKNRIAMVGSDIPPATMDLAASRAVRVQTAMMQADTERRIRSLSVAVDVIRDGRRD